MMKRILTACAAVIFAAACSAPALEEIQRPEEPEKPVVSEKATIPFSLTVTTESTRVSYADGAYQFKAGDKIHVQGKTRTDLEGYLTQNGNVWSGNLSYDGEQPATNTPLAITLVHEDNEDVSTYAKAIVGSAPEGSSLLREAVEKYSLFTPKADVDVTLSTDEVVLYQQAAFLDVTVKFDFDGSRTIEAGKALLDLGIDGKVITAETDFFPWFHDENNGTDEDPEDYLVHYMAVVPGGLSLEAIALKVGDRAIEFTNASTTILNPNKKYTVNRTLDYRPQLGDPFWSDGTYGRLRHPDSHASIVGIVVYVNNHGRSYVSADLENAITEQDAGYGHGLVMALKNAEVRVSWKGSADNRACLDENHRVTSPSEAMSVGAMSGISNTNAMINVMGANANSAASRARNYANVAPVSTDHTSGWFLPSIGQWIYSISIDGFGGADHADKWTNNASTPKSWLTNGTLSDLVRVLNNDGADVNLLVKSLNDRLQKLNGEFGCAYDSFGLPSPTAHISDNYWSSSENADDKAIRMNFGSVETDQNNNKYSTIKAKPESKSSNNFAFNNNDYPAKIRPFLAF